ncbi:MAG: hypothetical protein IRY95_07250 [Clostridia bacterium]|nr:hypothetical protein [Clostridia bacterium]
MRRHRPETILPPAAWVESTEPFLRRLAAQGVSVDTEAILRALDRVEANRLASVLGKDR